MEALASRDNEAIQGTLSSDTRRVLDDAVAELQTTAEQIEQLQPSDREDAREATGVAMLESVQSGRALFDRVFLPERLPGMEESAPTTAAERADDEVFVAEREVIILTRSGQRFELVLEEDGQWRVHEPMRSTLQGAVRSVEDNLVPVRRAVRLFGLAAEEAERMRRLGLIEQRAPCRQSRRPWVGGGNRQTPAGRLKVVASIALIQLALGAVRSTPPQATHADLCFREAGGIPSPCPAPRRSSSSPRRASSNAKPRPPCWWTATPGASRTSPASALRSGDGSPSSGRGALPDPRRALETVSGIESVLAERVAAQLETACGPTTGAR